jgi:hypothetical protein
MRPPDVQPPTQVRGVTVEAYFYGFLKLQLGFKSVQLRTCGAKLLHMDYRSECPIRFKNVVQLHKSFGLFGFALFPRTGCLGSCSRTCADGGRS